MSDKSLPASVVLADKALQPRRAKRPYPDVDDYIGKGRVAACCAKRRYGLFTNSDESEDLIAYATATYWHRLEVLDKSPASAWIGAMHRTRRYYWRCLRDYSDKYELDEFKPPLRLDQPLFEGEEEPTLLDTFSAAAQEATDMQALDWLSAEDLEQALIKGREAAGVSKQKIAYAINRGTVRQERAIIRLAAQGTTNAGIAELLGTTEGNVKHRRIKIREWLTALAGVTGTLDDVEPWDKSGGDPARAARIQQTYPDGKRPDLP